MPETLSAPVRPERIRPINGCGDTAPGPVLYWMSRDQRAADNWALLHAQGEALARGVPLVTVFCLAPVFLGGTLRQAGAGTPNAQDCRCADEPDRQASYR